MTEISDELKKQIESAFHYRGHVTVTFTDGQSVDGYLYNREYANPKTPEDHFIDVFLKGSGNPARYKISTVQSVALTGADEAAGKSYQDWMKKQDKKAKILEGSYEEKKYKILVTTADGQTLFWHKQGKIHLLDEDLAATWVEKFKPHLFDILPNGEMAGAGRNPTAFKISKVEKVPA